MIDEDKEGADGVEESNEQLTRLTNMAQNGSVGALNELLKRTEKIVRMKIASLLAKRRTRMQEADIDDLVQIIQIKIHKSLPTFRSTSKLTTWIHPIVENSYRDSVRRETTQIRSATILWGDMSTPQGESLEDILGFIESNIESTIDRTILINLVHEVIKDIESPVHRDLLEQIYIHGLTLSEYRKAHDIHMGTALSRSDKARTLFLGAIFDLLGSYSYIQLKREMRGTD